MIIFAKLIHPENGYEHDRERVKILDPNIKYVVTNVSVGRSSSSFGLAEFPGKSFNTIQFEFYEDGRLIDVINRFYNNHDYF